MKKLEMDLKKSSSLLSGVISDWTFPPMGQTILPVAVTQGDRLQAGAAYIGSRTALQHELQQLSVGESFMQHYGLLDDHHGLSKQSQPLGIRPTEPQITGGIAWYLQADGNQHTSRKRIQVFLNALLQDRGDQANLQHHINHLSEARNIQVSSEYLLANGQRMDLLIQWEMPGNQVCVVAIEAKFGHQVTVGQLPAYLQQVMRLAKGGNFATVLLTLDGYRSNRNKTWIPLTWTTLLTRWEKAVIPDDSQSFTLLKRMIWDKL